LSENQRPGQELPDQNKLLMNYPAAELRGIKMNFYLINPDAEHRGILLIKFDFIVNDLIML